MTNGFDLNNALGKYRTPSSAVVTSLLNKPAVVIDGEITIDWYPANSDNSYGFQILRWTKGTIHMIFSRNKNATTWNGWETYVTNSDLGGMVPTFNKTNDLRSIDFQVYIEGDTHYFQAILNLAGEQKTINLKSW